MTDIEKLLPHRKPMIVLSDIESIDIKNGTLTARIDIKETDILFDAYLRGVPTYSAVEYMAQAIGCFVGHYDLSQNKKPGIGFVLGSRKLEVFEPVLMLGNTYFIDVKALFVDDDIASFDCLIYTQEKQKIATAILNAYRPKNIEDFMKEKDDE